MKALRAFHQHGLGQLMPFTQQIWDALNEPKADRASLFAQIVGIKAKGKLAIRKLLTAFHDEATQARLDAIDARGPMPEMEDYSDTLTWFQQLANYLGAADAALLGAARITRDFQ